jgi:hypothetical protein
MKQLKQKITQLLPLAKKFTRSYGWLGALGATLWWSGVYVHAFWLFIHRYLA